MPIYFKPTTNLFFLTKGKKYKIKYVENGRQITDDRGKKRIVRPLLSELCR